MWLGESVYILQVMHMARFIPTCRQCFLEKGQTVLLEEANGKLVCPKNPKHETKNDVRVA